MLLLMPASVRALEDRNNIVWNTRQNAQTGLYTTKNYFVSQGVSLNASALYYFGDVDNEGVAFSGGFNENNLSYGGGLTFAYNLPLGNHCNLRTTVMGGTLRANNKVKFESLAEPRYDFRKFNSIIIQPAVGVQYYPFTNAGFYVYGGLAVTASIITDYEFYVGKNVNDPAGLKPVEGNTFGILPMLQLAIGYSWKLAPSWTLSAEIMIQEGLIDTHYMNLDAWPLDAKQSSDGEPHGNSWGKWTDRYGKEHIHWNDGWFQVGLTITYQWRNCETCRILNNYNGIKVQHSRKRR